MKQYFILLIIVLVGQSCQSNSQPKTTVLNSKTQKKIISKSIDIKDVENSLTMLKMLQSKDEDIIQNSIDSILENPNVFNPTVTYFLSNLLLEKGRKNEAMFWFYLSQVRTRVDINICKENAAKKDVEILNVTYGSAINEIAFLDVDTLKLVVEKVINFANSNAENYDKRWVSLYGRHDISELQDESKQNEFSEPITKWGEIKKSTIKSFYSDFIKYVIKKETK